MHTHKLIAIAAATLFTATSLLAVTYNVNDPRQTSSNIPTEQVIHQAPITVTNLAPITVTPSATEMRAAAMLDNVGNEVGMASTSLQSRLDDHLNMSEFSLLGSQLVMPYYSFGNKFGRIIKD
ncbi:MAG: hypothetical protein ABI268_03615 [Rhodanobacter sp.]